MKNLPTLETSGFRTGMRSRFGEVTRICFVTFDIQLRVCMAQATRAAHKKRKQLSVCQSEVMVTAFWGRSEGLPNVLKTITAWFSISAVPVRIYKNSSASSVRLWAHFGFETLKIPKYVQWHLLQWLRAFFYSTNLFKLKLFGWTDK